MRSPFSCLLDADERCHNWGSQSSRGSKVFPTHLITTLHLCKATIPTLQTSFPKTFKHPTVSHWVVQWSQITSNLNYLPSHIRTGSVALLHSACQPLFLVRHTYLYALIAKNTFQSICTVKKFQIWQLPKNSFRYGQKVTYSCLFLIFNPWPFLLLFVICCTYNTA